MIAAANILYETAVSALISDKPFSGLWYPNISATPYHDDADFRQLQAYFMGTLIPSAHDTQSLVPPVTSYQGFPQILNPSHSDYLFYVYKELGNVWQYIPAYESALKSGVSPNFDTSNIQSIFAWNAQGAVGPSISNPGTWDGQNLQL